MLFLEKTANKIIEQIILIGAGQSAFKINNAPGSFMAVHVEILPEIHIPALGMCRHVSLCHYAEQNGDLMRDPEVCFLQTCHGPRFAYYFRNDYTGTETCALDRESKTLNSRLIADLNEFSVMWMQNIAEQQGLNNILSARLSA